MPVSSWATLVELELRFARSRRRAQARRSQPRPRSPLAWRSVWAVLLALLLLLVAAESTRLETPTHSITRAAKPAARCPVPAPYSAAFGDAAVRAGVPLSLLVATAYEESRMDAGARSGVGAVGLLQLMPGTARELRLDRADPEANILAGALYLRRLLDRFGSVELALAAYNAGPTAVAGAGAAPTIGSLRYALNVQARAARLRGFC